MASDPMSPTPSVPPSSVPETPLQPPPTQTPEGWSGYAPPYAPYPSYPNTGYTPYPYPYGAPGYVPWMYAPPAPRLGTWALVSMICGAISIASFQSVLAILAIIFGFIGLNEIKKSAGQVEGRGLAIAGVVMGFVSLGIGLLILVLYILYFVVIFSTISTMPG